MTAKKTYAISGLNSVKLIFYLNKNCARFHVEFTNGSKYNGIPATFTTTDPACQAAIEADERFGRQIMLQSVYYFDDDNQQMPDSKHPEEKEEAVGVTVVDSVSDINGVVDYLKGNYGVSGNQLRSIASIKRKVNELSLSFPNVEVLKED